ncbi:MAG: hypothetical protein IKC47_02840 [Clostridia bacterium]|nr:hypothetical protein [Clostridia bacterium]
MNLKQIKRTKALATLNWVFVIFMVVANVLALIVTQSVNNKINANPGSFPENFSMEFGLTMTLFLVYSWFFQGAYALAAIALAVVKNLSVKKQKICIADKVISCLTVLLFVAPCYFGIGQLAVIFKAMSCGVGFGFIPYVVSLFLQLAVVVLNVVHAFATKAKSTEVVLEA